MRSLRTFTFFSSVWHEAPPPSESVRCSCCLLTSVPNVPAFLTDSGESSLGLTSLPIFAGDFGFWLVLGCPVMELCSGFISSCVRGLLAFLDSGPGSSFAFEEAFFNFYLSSLVLINYSDGWAFSSNSSTFSSSLISWLAFEVFAIFRAELRPTDLAFDFCGEPLLSFFYSSEGFTSSDDNFSGAASCFDPEWSDNYRSSSFDLPEWLLLPSSLSSLDDSTL